MDAFYINEETFYIYIRHNFLETFQNLMLIVVITTQSIVLNVPKGMGLLGAMESVSGATVIHHVWPKLIENAKY